MFKTKHAYLKGKSVFIVSILVVSITVLTVNLSGVHYNRTVNNNLYLSLFIIGIALFTFLFYGLFKGIKLKDNFPKYYNFKYGNIISQEGNSADVPIDLTEGVGGLILSILLWIASTIILFVLLFLLEAVLWLSIVVIVGMLYWLFFRALKLVFSKSQETKGDYISAIKYALGYTLFYLGWIFVIVYLAQQ